MAEVDRHLLFTIKRKKLREWLDGPPTGEPPPFDDMARLVWEGAPENVAPDTPLSCWATRGRNLPPDRCGSGRLSGPGGPSPSPSPSGPATAPYRAAEHSCSQRGYHLGTAPQGTRAGCSYQPERTRDDFRAAIHW